LQRLEPVLHQARFSPSLARRGCGHTNW
jgi:hypothetical protein